MSDRAAHPQKLLLFSLVGERPFALGTLKVREIVPCQPLTHLPHSHPAVIGTMSFRGRAVPVVDMAAAVGYPPLTETERQQGSIIVTDVQRTEMGFLVRKVSNIIEIDWKEVRSAPKGLGSQAFVAGLLERDGKLVQLLDLELLLAKIYPASAEGDEVNLTDVQSEQLKTLHILIVDDSKVARKQLSDVLDQHDISYQVATNGQDALQMVMSANEGTPVDVLVSDIEMPEMDGYELTFSIRDNQSLNQPYVILHSSLNSEMSVSYARQVGADEALTKFDAGELLMGILRGIKHQ